MSRRRKEQLKHMLNAKGQYEQRKTLKKVRQEVKNNRQPKARIKDWQTSYYYEEEEDDGAYTDHLTEERIMPRGERQRRRDLEAAALMELDNAIPPADQPLPPSGKQGMVTEVSTGLCRVELASRTILCSLRGTLSASDTGFTNVVAVGDQVVVSENGKDQGVVEAVLPRRSMLARPDVFYNHLRQVIVANIDQLLIVVAWRNPHLWPELIDRYLITAERNNLRPLLCVNKVDLAEDRAACQKVLQPYLDLGYPVIFTSVVTGEGIAQLQALLLDQATVLAGMSGVGKSSLLAAVQPGLEIRIGDVSEDSGEGRHTTSQVNWHKLAAGGAIVDTPGIRSIGLSGLQPGELVRFYPEIAEAAGRCRFSDCSHLHEPGCAVKVALKYGHISTMRYENYQKIYEALA